MEKLIGLALTPHLSFRGAMKLKTSVFLEKVSHKELLFNPITCTIRFTFIVFQRKFLIKNSSFNPIACLYHRYNILLVLITIKLGGQLYGSPLHKPKLYILVMCFEQKSGHLLIFL